MYACQPEKIRIQHIEVPFQSTMGLSSQVDCNHCAHFAFKILNDEKVLIDLTNWQLTATSNLSNVVRQLHKKKWTKIPSQLRKTSTCFTRVFLYVTIFQVSFFFPNNLSTTSEVSGYFSVFVCRKINGTALVTTSPLLLPSVNKYQYRPNLQDVLRKATVTVFLKHYISNLRYRLPTLFMARDL